MSVQRRTMDERDRAPGQRSIVEPTWDGSVKSVSVLYLRLSLGEVENSLSEDNDIDELS